MAEEKSGAFGERKAANYLRLHGYKIIDTNCRYRQGEIDIIAKKHNYIVFAEVKLRKNNIYGEAREFVSEAKQRRIIMAAQLWLQGHETDLQPRFDVIEIYAPEGIKSKKLTINHIKNAF
jgi:putative endonuclease